MQLKMKNTAEMFGMEPEFLYSRGLSEPPRKHILFDLDLFSVTSLLLFSAASLYALDDKVHVVFMEVDRYPAVCMHFRVDSEEYELSAIRKLLSDTYASCCAFMNTSLGENARKEAEKIPGVGHMIRNDRYSAFGDHALSLFVPVKSDWTDFVLHCPLPSLPESFYDGFDFPALFQAETI